MCVLPGMSSWSIPSYYINDLRMTCCNPVMLHVDDIALIKTTGKSPGMRPANETSLYCKVSHWLATCQLFCNQCARGNRLIYVTRLKIVAHPKVRSVDLTHPACLKRLGCARHIYLQYNDVKKDEPMEKTQIGSIAVWKGCPETSYWIFCCKHAP